MNKEIVSADLWQSKPWWCQPWTIILTGVLLIAGSWLGFHSLWLTLPLTLLIGVWWIYFLVLVPQMLRQIKNEGFDFGATDAPADDGQD